MRFLWSKEGVWQRSLLFPTHAFRFNRQVAVLLSTALLSWAGVVNATAFDPSHAGYDALLKRYVSDGRVDCKGLIADSEVLERYLDGAAGVENAQFNAWTETERLTFLINLYNAATFFKWYGEDFSTGYSPAPGFSGLDQTERAVANFCSRYLSASDRDYLRTGGYSVKYLDYDWSLNEQASA